MSIKTRGEKPRPRAAILGEWPSASADEAMKLFPTSYAFKSSTQLAKTLIPNEVDVLICMGDSLRMDASWLSAGWEASNVHTIVFGGSPNTLVQYSGGLWFTVSERLCRSMQHDEMAVPPILEGPLRSWLATFQDSRGMPIIVEGWWEPGSPFRNRGANLESVALVMAQVPRGPLAVHHFDKKTKKGVAWFPSPPPNPLDWIRALLFHWAESDPERLPGLRDWEMTAEWMTSRELDLSAELAALAQRRDQVLKELESEDARLRMDLVAARVEGNAGPRRILTSQDDELASAVAQVLRDLGFDVREMDKEIPPGKSKREDLRLALGSKPGWEGIVEVKGYAKSGGKMTDIMQLEKHAAHYAVQNHRLPDKRLYVVNGEFETAATPSLRRLPFSDEDLAPFATDGGLALTTAELFRLHRDRESIGVESIQRILTDSNGRLPPEHQIGPSGS